MRSFKGVIVCYAALMLATVYFLPICFGIDAAEASDAVSQAERDFGLALTAVAEAEKAGADVSVLLNKLENAGSFLSDAYIAYRVGDYSNASLCAVECSRAVEGVANDAASLKIEAEIAQGDRLILASSGSVVGLVLLLVLGMCGWCFLKRQYFKRVLGMKPEMETV